MWFSDNMFKPHYNESLTSMKPEMDPEAALCREQLLTDLTFKVFNTQMYFCVCSQRALDSK